MRVAVWPADQAGCGHYRLKFPARALADQGADVVVDTVGPKIVWSHKWDKHPTAAHRVMGVLKYDADIVVMQRPGQRWWSDIIPHLQAQGIKVVVDVDDRFDVIPKGNVAFKGYQGDVISHEWIDRACKLADAVTVTTPALLHRYGYGKGTVLPNLVPASYVNVFGLKRPETVGWPGLVGIHPGDLQSTQGGVAAALGDWSFHVIGDGVGVRSGLGLAKQPSATGFLGFDEYALAVAELEVGIVPLGQTVFNQAKSALKASEMAALGVPVVMSPTPDNLRLHKLGIGLLAESRGQWRKQVGKLIASSDLRYEMAESGREVMATQTYEQHCGRWWDAWTGKAKEMVA